MEWELDETSIHIGLFFIHPYGTMNSIFTTTPLDTTVFCPFQPVYFAVGPHWTFFFNKVLPHSPAPPSRNAVPLDKVNLPTAQWARYARLGQRHRTCLRKSNLPDVQWVVGPIAPRNDRAGANKWSFEAGQYEQGPGFFGLQRLLNRWLTYRHDDEPSLRLRLHGGAGKVLRVVDFLSLWECVGDFPFRTRTT